MSLMYGALSYVSKISDDSYRFSDQLDEILVTQEFLRNLLENIYPERNSFRGNAGQMTFLSLIAKEGHYRKLYKVRLHFSSNPKKNGSNNNLIIEWQSLNPSLDQKDQGSVILVNDINKSTFLYLDSSRSDMPPVWLDVWNENSTLPAKIKISLSREGERILLWPELIVPLKINKVVNCTYNIEKRRCYSM